MSAVINVDPRGICKTASPGDGAPVKEDCLVFNPKTAEVKFLNNDWKIVDGSHWIFSFGNKKTEADKSLQIIKHYGMNQTCYVGRPGPSFSYLLKSGASPVGAFPGEDWSPSTPIRRR